MNQEPLAIYRERLLQVRRVLALYPDRIEVQAKWLGGGRFSYTVRLSDLRAKPTEARIRQRIWRKGLIVAMLAAAAAVVVQRYAHWGQTAMYILWSIAVAAGIFTLIAWKKVQFMRFTQHDGKPGLDIARSGPDADRFDQFIEQVRQQIRRASR